MGTQPAFFPYRNAPAYTRMPPASWAEAAQSTSTLPLLRNVLAPEYAALPHMELVEFMESEYGEGSAEEYEAYLEGFFGSVGNFFKKAAPVVANIAGGVVKGATTGAALGLPGIIGGAVAGGVGQGFASYGKGSLRKIGQGLNTGLGVASQFSPTGRIGGTVGGALSSVGQGRNIMQTALGATTSLIPGAAAGRAGGIPALTQLLGTASGSNASQLMRMLDQPAMKQALASLAMGPRGRQTIPVGSAGRPVPTSAFAGLINQLAQSVLDEQAEFSDGSEADLGYLMDDTGEWIVDPAESEERAAVLYEMLNIAELERVFREDEEQEWEEAHHRARIARRMREAEAWEMEQEAAWFEAGSWDEGFLGEYEEDDESAEFEEYHEFEEFDEAFLFGEYDELDELTYA